LEEIFSVAPPIAHYAPETKIAACSISPTLAEIIIPGGDYCLERKLFFWIELLTFF
jgi:hypothetical protein